MNVDFGLTAQDYAEHRAGFPDSLFERLTDFGIGTVGQKIVDLGTGTGSLARGFALRGCRVIGIDPAEDMLAHARALDLEAGLSIEYQVATAEATGLPSASAQVVAAGQCWHWFERALAAKEASRILHPGGCLLITHFDWLPIKGNIVAETEDLILAHNPSWNMSGGDGMYPQWLPGLSEAGFRDIETFSYDQDVPYTHTSWRGRIRASAGVGASLTAEKVEIFDRALATLLKTKYPEEILQVPHRVFAVIARLNF
ncbi:MAG: class I SAM-dependent methyltransferase [Chloroflexi bacterium]|nr:class I SAM-dependent methyltransferase [Chloroflexota bacterium]